jgi:ABC-type glycerol-3-phosphate transport system substrate-binding protein
MAAEKVAMKLSSGWGPPIIYGINPALQAADALEMAPVPVKAGTDPQIRTTAWLSSWVINRNTKYPEQSWRLVKFITSKEMEQKWFDDARVLSSRRDVSEQYQPLLQDKFAKVIAAELSRAKFVPQLVEWPQIIEAVNVAVQEGYIGKDPMRALKDAHDKINNILAIYRKAYPAGSIVAAGDFDDGKPLDWLGVGYYQDVDKDGKVSPGDKRLKNVVEPCPAF